MYNIYIQWNFYVTKSNKQQKNKQFHRILWYDILFGRRKCTSRAFVVLTVSTVIFVYYDFPSEQFFFVHDNSMIDLLWDLHSNNMIVDTWINHIVTARKNKKKSF